MSTRTTHQGAERANHEDFKRVHEYLVYDYAGDDHLEEFGFMV